MILVRLENARRSEMICDILDLYCRDYKMTVFRRRETKEHKLCVCMPNQRLITVNNFF